MEFEKKLKRLEEIVKAMEDGQISLEKSLEFFEEGVKLSRECSVQLQEAEQKVKVLVGVGPDGNAITKSFTPESKE